MESFAFERFWSFCHNSVGKLSATLELECVVEIYYIIFSENYFFIELKNILGIEYLSLSLSLSLSLWKVFRISHFVNSFSKKGFLTYDTKVNEYSCPLFMDLDPTWQSKYEISYKLRPAPQRELFCKFWKLKS